LRVQRLKQSKKAREAGNPYNFKLTISTFEALLLASVMAAVDSKSLRGKCIEQYMLLPLHKKLVKSGFDFYTDCAKGMTGTVRFPEEQENHGAN
jgi:hypothetical protein